MKTNILYTFSLTLLIFAACSKKSPVNNDTDTKFPENIADTWSKTIVSLPTDTFTMNGSDSRWVKDKSILTSNEADKLKTMIMGVPKPIRDEFASKFKKFTDRLHSPEIITHSDTQTAMNTQEYKDLATFCSNNEKSALPLAIGFLFIDTDEIGVIMATWCMENLVLKGKFKALKEEVTNEIVANPKTPDGKYIISYGTTAFHRRLAKKIINQL